MKLLFITYVDVFNPQLNHTLLGNSGDLVYNVACVSYFLSPDIDCTFITHKQYNNLMENDKDFFKRFDKVIINEANIFAECHIPNMQWRTEFFKQIKKPVIVLGAGAQSGLDYSLKFLKSSGDYIKAYLDTLFSFGGTISLRGYFTQYVLEYLGYENLFVSGCPSLYKNGANFAINKTTTIGGGGNSLSLGRNDFNPCFNGYTNNRNIEILLKAYPQSYFIDQDEFKNVFFATNSESRFTNQADFKHLLRVLKHPLIAYCAKLVQNRARLFYEFDKWQDFLRKNANFVYGQRIHGNIMGLLAGIPCFVDVIDSRTREIAEFYHIPNSFDTPFNPKKHDLFELYKSLDFSDFNANYKIKFVRFKKFLSDNNIPNTLR